MTGVRVLFRYNLVNSERSINLKSKVGYIYILLTTFIFGINPIIFKSLSGFTSSNIQNFFRTLVAGIVLWMYSKYLKKTDKTSTKIGLLSFIPPALIFYLFVQLYITGISLSKANLSSFIMSGLGPIITIIVLGLFIAEERKQLKNTYVKASIIIGLTGAVLVMLNLKQGLNFTLDFGLFLVFLGAVAWALYAMLIRKYFSQVNPIIFCRNVIGLNAMFFFFTIIITKEIFLLNTLSVKLILGLIAAGLIADAISNITFFLGMTKVSAINANIILLLAPVISLIVSKITLNESLAQQQLIGCLMTLLASFLLIFVEIKKNKQSNIEIKY